MQCRQAHKHRKTCKACNDKSKCTHEHAVLDDKKPKGLRISINTKHIPPEDIAAWHGGIQFLGPSAFATGLGPLVGR
jgi:hypothetical protein